LNFSSLYTQHNDNNNNTIIVNNLYSYSLFEQYENGKIHDNFIYPNNGENNPTENIIANNNTKENFKPPSITQTLEKKKNLFHLSENNKSNKKKGKINDYKKSKKKIENNSNGIKNTTITNEKESETHKKVICDEKNNYCLFGCEDEKEQKSSQTNFPIPKKSLIIFLYNPSNNIFYLPIENALLNINLNNESYSSFGREGNKISSQSKQNNPSDIKFCNKKREREKDEITDNEKENKANDINFRKKRDIVMKEMNKDKRKERLFEFNRSVIREFKNYLETQIIKIINVFYKVSKIKSCSEDEIKNLFSNNLNGVRIFNLYKNFIGDEDYSFDKYFEKKNSSKKKDNLNYNNERDLLKNFRKNFHILYNNKSQPSELKF